MKKITSNDQLKLKDNRYRSFVKAISFKNITYYSLIQLVKEFNGHREIDGFVSYVYTINNTVVFVIKQEAHMP